MADADDVNPGGASPPPKVKKRLTEAWKRSAHFYQKEIWQPAQLRDKSARGYALGALRLFSTTWTVFMESRTMSRAAALSFSTMLGIAPAIALSVLIAGVVLGQQDPAMAVEKLGGLFRYVAPTVGQDELVALMTRFVTGARSGSAGVLGALSLVIVVLLLFHTIEDAFNDIWGVRKGRSILTRIVVYWSIFTLGAVLFLASITGLGVGAIARAVDHLPVSISSRFGPQIVTVFQYMVPLLSEVLLISILALFYRVIPNTKVLWRAAAMGALIAAALLTLNNYLTFLYVQRVAMAKSLYGTVALPLILLSSLYVFWLYVLIGGIISYAVQNVHFRNSQAAWSRLNETQRELLSLVVLLTICRRFQACLPPVSSLQLSTMTKVPTQILNECLSRLVDMKLVAPLSATETSGAAADTLYQPARPLNRITLFDFKTLDDNLGENPMGETLERLDPILHAYKTALNQLAKEQVFQKSLEELLAEHPFEDTIPPFQRISGS